MTTIATAKMISSIEAKVGKNPEANEVQDAVTEIVAEVNQMFVGIDQTQMVKSMVIRYWMERGR